ncbi:HD-GYP domain-containing protein [Evansella cellulosilytica]|uniref:Metal dependent phosphohydrolase n=1 Tax=Evansella cellulosilytica (strain ATCC 21833 / DSM 2522 / FERM P-1141 / JCM 9156 / N-4) TaxID=649639 RepID=E6TRK7_EVAC2|nr:HD-GYP domain-containing protein [Evansella cellulosilytica]ADU28301.1 metal dependent phosphohydrolase [Evansella cellulosilytica DSM 2522]
MKVKIEYLIPGTILAEDIYKKTNTPIMKKKTVLTNELINILKIFMVPSVTIENKLENGSLFKANSVIVEDAKRKDTIEDPFIDRYLFAVQQFKKLFNHWQGGTKVDAFAVRKVFLPLYNKTPKKEDLIQLHHYSNKNEYIYFHSVAVSVLSSLVGRKMGLSNGEVIQLGLSGLLSDCGMAKLPFNVFEKKGALTIDEYEQVKTHPLFGYRMLEDVAGFTKEALLGVLQHHEREDGSGYQYKLKSNKIHLFAKIISICDIYHAMTSERHYRTKKSPYKVIESLRKEHFGKIDHIVLHHFTQVILDLSIGTKVRLSSNDIGEIVFLDEKEPTRPTIKLENGNLFELTSHHDVYVEEQLLE